MQISSPDKHHISLLFPSYVVFEDNIPEFLPVGDRCILFSDTETPSIDSDTLFISKWDGVDISRKDGFLQTMENTRFFSIEKDIYDKLIKLDNESFWHVVKTMLVCKISKKDIDEVVGVGSYVLFEHIFRGYLKTYPIYKKMKTMHRRVMSSMLTMFSNCVLDDYELEKKSYKPWFLSIIREHKKNINRFKSCALRYALSRQTEMDFLTFLAEMDIYK